MDTDANAIRQLVGNTDIYLLDQIIKGRYHREEKILDAGCGTGRNLHWFMLNQLSIYGIDQEIEAIEQLKMLYPYIPADRLVVGGISHMPYQDLFFDHIISSAVLHFARNESDFMAMFREMARILKPGGTIFIRMATDIGIETAVVPRGNGIYLIPDGSERFLLTRTLLGNLLREYDFLMAEPFKTVNVQDMRCMSTLVLQKRKV